MPANNFQKRIQSLFSDIEHIASDPQRESAAMRRELEALQARLVELESEFLEMQKRKAAKESKPVKKGDADVEMPASPTSPAAPSLYEKERVGYAFSQDHLEPLTAPAQTGLEETEALHAPLTEAGKPIGAVMVEPPPQSEWSSDEAELADAVARQASLQIQNLRLLAAAERARAEAQSATRRFAHESWDSFLDAIHQSERIGYVYDQGATEPYAGPPPAEVDFQASVSVLDEQIGRLLLRADPSHPLDEEDKELVSAVAHQLGQQVESLRLLADAARARAEAEEASRRLARDSWKDYAERKEDSTLAYVYDSNEVSPLADLPDEVDLSQPLVVRGEPIGQLAVTGLSEVSPETAELMSAIAARASIHLETLRLTEELQRRAAELQELDRLKSSFLANMSHELRTPLNSILGFSDVMLEGIDGPLTEYMESDLKLIQKNGKHLLHLINDVLDMAKIESGRMNLHPEKFRVHDVLEEVTSITSTLASERNLSLFIEADSNKDVEILADVTRIRQVVINLVNNAIKFTEKGKVTLRVDPAAGDKVMIVIQDTGIGIPADKLEVIFQEFSQVDSSTTRKAGGTGLGLPISRRLVEMHGGRLWAESSGVSGEGSTFYVELPLEARLEEPVEVKEK